MLIASVMEFAGAVLVGSRVADTIRNKIISVKAFEDEPAVLMLGKMTLFPCVCLSDVRRHDVCSHWILALAYCRYEDWFACLHDVRHCLRCVLRNAF
jgi:Phosphate transporter family